MGPKLSSVLDLLGPQTLWVVVDAGRLGDPVGDVVLGGLDEPVPAAESGLLLLPGAQASLHAAISLIRTAADAGYLAIVVKASGEALTRLATEAGSAGLALLTAPPEASWRHLDSLLTAGRAAIAVDQHPGLEQIGAGDVFALANAIASAVGGAVIIEDPQRRVIAHSNLPGQQTDGVRRRGILGRIALNGPLTDDMYRAVAESPEAVTVPSPEPGVADRLAVAVRAGGRVIGTIWVISDRPPLAEEAGRILVDAARTAALHLLRARARSDPERHARAEALRTLLDGDGDPAGLRGRLGFQRGTAVAVLAVRGLGTIADVRLATTPIDDVVSLYADSWHPGTPTAIDGNVVYALLPMDQPAARPRLAALAADLARAVQRSVGVEVVAAIGPTASALTEVPATRRTADRMLRVLAHPGPWENDDREDGDRPRVALAEQLRSRVLLQALSEQSLVVGELRLEPVTAILEHDEAHGTEYARTLVAWFGAFGDVTHVATDLVVHDNTVRYRVRRIQEMFGVDLNDPDDVLCTWLQLRLLADRR
ncbi:helix-turn-helix domain-containing protein [Kineosporia sp. J2-2]|uniref:Helix-turn-helix domain-containing protein n=1 Tax=Kineosporia corallincola TaxID=2835133 RepID=A0ABS5TK13_9ACTN|nr:helix-turn-helix domain-containing protein [Kineosporia corallincola]MBT0770729.1 helix-turn-helix domain-containing protein [Kineosporia corallincola]